MNKKEYYSEKEVVSNYAKKRFSGKSGQYVNRRELEIIKSLLPLKGKILDVPCGEGRLLQFLKNKYTFYGIDSSKEMLDLAKKQDYKELKQANASKLPFKDNTFDSVVSLRFLFHYENIKLFLQEFKKVAKTDIVFDTLAWTPRLWNGFPWNKFGGKIYIHSTKKITNLLKELDLKLIEKKSAFLFSTQIYKNLPYSIVKIFHNIEKIIPNSLKSAHYWRVRK